MTQFFADVCVIVCLVVLLALGWAVVATLRGGV